MDRGPWYCTGGSEQNHSKGKKSKKAKWLSEEALQIAEEIKKKAKSKGERKRYTQLKAKF